MLSRLVHLLIYKVESVLLCEGVTPMKEGEELFAEPRCIIYSHALTWHMMNMKRLGYKARAPTVAIGGAWDSQWR